MECWLFDLLMRIERQATVKETSIDFVLTILDVNLDSMVKWKGITFA